jgi:hypothetical protein
VSSSCCAESTACAGDVACANYYQCVGACKASDVQCRSQCGVDQPFTSAPEWPAVQACMAGHCATECGLKCGGIAAVGFAPPNAATSCQACFEANGGCSAAQRCASSVDCASWIQCFNACSAPDCRIACGIRYGYGDGGAVLAPLPPGPPDLALLPGTCSAACGVGANWTCVGKVRSRVGMGSTTLSTIVRDLGTGAPVAGAAVSLCRFKDQNCTSPVVPTQTTDDAGYVAFNVPFANFGFASTADSYTQVLAPGFIPALYFIGYSVTEPQAPLAEPDVIVGTSAESAPIFATEMVDPNLATVQAGVFDCDGAGAGDVRLSIDSSDPGILPYYYQTNGGTWVPDFKATATIGSFAYGGFVNVPPGMVTLTATPVGHDKPAAQVHVLARAGTISNYFMYPTP